MCLSVVLVACIQWRLCTVAAATAGTAYVIDCDEADDWHAVDKTCIQVLKKPANYSEAR